MNESRPRNSEIERLLAGVHLPEASWQLRNQVTTAARQAWDSEPAGVPWCVPVRRLALSAAAAVVVISLANHLGALAGPEVRTEDPAATSVPDSDLEQLTQTVYGPSWSRLGTSHRRSSEVNLVTLRDRMEAIRGMLDELEHPTSEARQAPNGGARRLPPYLPDSSSYS